MSDFAGSRYKLVGLVRQGPARTVFRAYDQQLDRPVLIRILHGVGPEEGNGLGEYLAGRHEFHSLEHPRLGRHLALDLWHETFYLVEELHAGHVLGSILRDGVLSRHLVLEVVCQLCEGLEHAHARGIRHLAIDPDNVICATPSGRPLPAPPESVEARLCGFGEGALRSGTDSSQFDPAQRAYLSPEQRGEVPGPVGPRSDIWALGVLLLEGLTGRLPAPTGDPLAPPADEARGRELPPALEGIVARCLACDPERRTPDAATLRRELEGARAALPDSPWSGLGLPTLPEPELRSPLIERDMELKRLCTQFDQAMLRRGSAVHLVGSGGSGKSRLIEECRSYVLAKRGIFLWAPATGFEQNRPFAPLRDALRQFIGQTRNYPAAQREHILARVREAVGPFAGELLPSFPELEPLFPASPDLVTLDPERENQRSTRTVLNLLRALGGPESPVVLCVDDYQWADQRTRDLIERLAGTIASTHMLLLLSQSHSEEEGADAPHLAFDDEVGGTGTIRIRLGPLSSRGSRTLFESCLGRRGTVITDIAAVAHDRCGGNPRDLMEVIQTIRPDLGDIGEYESISPEMHQLQSLIPRADIESLASRRWQQLATEHRRVLTVAAALGRRFPLSHLEAVVGGPAAGTREAVAEGVRQRILANWSALGDDWHHFTHEELHEYVVSSLSPAESEELHGRIATALEGIRRSEKDLIYEIALHALRGGDPVRAFERSLAAARAARRAYANREAIYFFTECLERIPSGSEALRLEIVEELGDLHALEGEYDRAESRYGEVGGAVADRIRKGRLEGKIGDMYFRRGRNEAAIRHLGLALSWLGVRLPRRAPGILLSIAGAAGKQALRTFTGRRFVRRRGGLALEKTREAVKILHNLSYAYYFIDLERTLAVHLKQLNLAEHLGPSRELGHTYSAHGIVCAVIPLHRRADRYQREGLKIRRELQDLWGVGQSYAFLGVCNYYRGQISEALEFLLKGIRILESTGDQWEIEAAYTHLAFCYLHLGEIDAAEDTSRTLLRLAGEIHDAKFLAFSQCTLADVDLIRGNLARALESTEKALAATGEPFPCAFTMRAQGQVLRRLGRSEEARRVLERSIEVIREHGLRNEYLVANYVALAQVLLDDARLHPALGRPERRALLRRCRKLLDKGFRLTRGFPNQLGYALRVRAVYYALRGDRRRSHRTFRESRRILERQGRIHELGLTLLEAARWRIYEGGRPDGAELEAAIDYLRRAGAALDLEEARELKALLDPTRERENRLRRQDRQLTTLLKMSRTISSILDLDRLVEQVTDLAIEATRADRGTLLLGTAGEEARVRCARDVTRKDREPALPPEARELVRRTLQSGVGQVDSIPPPEEGAGADKGSSLLCVPLVGGGEPFGAMLLESSVRRQLYSEEDLEFVTAFAAQAAVALTNAFSFQRMEAWGQLLEQRVLERTAELLRSKQELENANRLKNEFLANMSHELRTPLNAVITMSEVLLERTFGELTEKQATYLEQVLDGGVHLLALINDVLDLSKIEAGQLSLESDLFDLDQLLERSLGVVRERASRQGLELELRPGTGGALVRGDIRRIKQVVFNLLSNAVKFTPAGGRVTLISTREEDRVVVTVEDTGIGIEPEDQELIFEQFRQVESVYSRQHEGTGLGLALSKNIVELHRGRIWVESEVGYGSRFSFSLPLGAEAAEPGGEPYPAAAPQRA